MAARDSDLLERVRRLSPERRRLLAHRARQQGPVASSATRSAAVAGTGALGFSLFFFGDRGPPAAGTGYDLLLECARFADENGFEAVWTPERHFHEFGAPYPNPSVLAAALAMVTRNLAIRAGSVVLPLHNPIRVAEEWSVVDNLSGGRVGLSVAPGWSPLDFALLSDAGHGARKETMLRQIEVLQELWRTGVVPASLVPAGQTPPPLYPRPVQRALPLWLTSSKDPASWATAGRLGAGVLTGLMEQSVDDLPAKVALYRESLRAAGFAPETARITLMLHTFVGEREEELMQARDALASYLRRHMGLYESLVRTADPAVDLDRLTEDDRRALVNLGLERYFDRSSLIGPRKRCAGLCDRLRGIGVTEIACLVDFGLPSAQVLKGLEEVSRLASGLPPGVPESEAGEGRAAG